MSATIKQVEAIPASYPATPSGLSTAAAALDPDVIWQRIEGYISHRWTARSVVWTVEGSGEWSAPLTPATISAAEVWLNDAWSADTLTAAPMGGYVLDADGPYRFTASVGSGTVPAAVNEAFKRLAEYMAEDPGKRGASNFNVDIGPVNMTIQRSPAWLANAMKNSGAGDLLRPYRRA